MKLKEKVAIVTGASRGIGKAIAIGYAKEGASVVIAARTETDNPQYPGTIYKTVEAIEKLGFPAVAIKTDVTSEDSVNAMVKQVLDKWGHIDILVNNAGVAFHYKVVDTPLKRWDLVLKVNLYGAFICAKAVLPGMIQQKSGSIINISSLSANDRDEGMVPTGLAYGVAKLGIDRFTFGLAAELGQHNIAVNAIKPLKVVDTEGMRVWQGDVDKSEWQNADKMVKCAIFLAQQDAHGVTASVSTDDELTAWHGL